MKKSFYQEFKDKTKQSLTRLRLEKRGIYNVSFNEKKASGMDIDSMVIMYIKGYHNIRRDIGLGANHIKLHLEENSEGEINASELLNLGNSIREYLKMFKEPFIDEKGAKIYEWENDENVRFRAVVDKIPQGHLEQLGEEYQRGGSQPPLSPSDEIIITFYSDRNLNEKMEFKNPKVKEFYENKEKSKNSQNISKLRLK
ncbi:hypothetical protein ACX9UE_001349 [Campylobacter upsaliensis]|nr:hypothetical protein [Campylobacter upsaliensis]EAW7618411.1 hypothetical protein [Campylobacter upsaliensis]EJE0943346.1 hypothetical protein [Campylobacter upsaliensis]ELZ7567414.1 hypothetical protein [Campylobacter upsaliensis]HEC1546166.1 hypothetical protein [Campylobacter upsaliensis]